MRHVWVLVHRYAGLLIAGFLFLSGVTGAVISWDHELDEWLNPHLTHAPATGPAQDAISLATALEARHPHAQVTYVPLAAEPGHSLPFGVGPRVDPGTRQLYPLAFNQVFVDPVSGQELGTREWGAVWPITRETFVSFLYKLHFTLHLPEMAGSAQWGVWLLGVIAMIWTLDCFVGAYLTLPVRPKTESAAAGRTWWSKWKPAWKIRTRAGGYKLNFDLHRAVSLWTWGVLFVVAFTAFSLNLYREVFFPMMSLVSTVTPTPFDVRTPAPLHQPIAPSLDFRQAIARAQAEASGKGWEAPPGDVFYAPSIGVYGVRFFRPEDDHGSGGVGHRTIYLDGVDGRTLGEREPWKGTAADIFVQAQFPLHSGRILGIPGRILISAMGIVVAMLSVTGVVIWLRKRASRARAGSSYAAARNSPRGA